MKDKSKKLLVINTGKKGASTASETSGSSATFKGGSPMALNMSEYLLKAIWNKAFEIKIDERGNEYLFGRLPLAMQYGITTYADGNELDLTTIYDGLPIDWSTIYWEEVKDADGNVTGRVLKAAAGSSGEGGDVVVSGITVEQLAAYLSTNKYATQPWVEGKGYLTSITSAMVTGALGFTPFDDASFTKANIKSKLGISDWALASSKPSYTYSEITGLGDELSKYIPISGYTEILGEKNFTGGLKVNGCPIVYDATKKYWKLEGDLLVTGGVTTHASDSAFKPSTIMDALVLDSTTLGINDDGELYVKGGGGGLTEVHWSDVLDRPTKLSQFTDDVVSGKYLTLNTSTTNILTSSQSGVLNFKSTSTSEVGIRLYFGETNGGGLWYAGIHGMYLYNAESATQLGLLNDGTPYYQDLTYNKRHLWHSGNLNPANYLPTTGGTVGELYVGGESVGTGHLSTRSSKARLALISFTDGNNYIESGNSAFSANAPLRITGKSAGLGSDLYLFFNNIYCRGNNYVNIDSGNYSSYALPLTGGIIKGSSDTPLQIKSPIYGFVGLNLFTDETLALHLGYWDKLGGVRFENLRNQSKSGIGVLDNGLVVQYSYDDSYNFTKNKIWHEGNDGSGSGLDADLLDGLDSSAFFQSKGRFWSTYINSVLGNGVFWTAEYTPVTGAYNYGTVLSFRGDGRQTQFYITDGQQKAGTGGRIFFRDSWNAQETMSARWLEIITNENIGSQTVSKANQLTTARTIWGQSFDGTKDISGVISGATTVYFAGGTTYYLGSTGNINCNTLTANGATTLKSTLGVTGAVTMESNLLIKGHVTSYSQRSLKNVIDERGLSLEELVTINPTRYTWKDGRDELVHIGGIADDVQKVLPEVVFDNKGILTMDYAMAGFAIAASLIKPVAKHEEDIESLKKRIKELEMEVERLTMN